MELSSATKTEFNSIFTIDLIETKRIILSVWYQVTKREVYEYSTSLADRFAAVWQGDADVVGRSLYAPLTGQLRRRSFITHDTMRGEADS